MEMHVSATFQKYGNMRFRPVLVFSSACVSLKYGNIMALKIITGKKHYSILEEEEGIRVNFSRFLMAVMY